MKDNTRTLGVVALVGALLVGGIVTAVVVGRSRLLDEEEAKAQIKDIAAHVKSTEASDEQAREKLIRKLPKTLDKRKEKSKPLPEETKQDLNELYNSLTPEQQAFYIQQMVPQAFAGELAKFNEKYKTREERDEAIARIVTDVRTPFDALTHDELWERKQSIESVQGKAYLGTIQKFFEGNLSSDQRSEFEPIMREVLRQIKVLVELRAPSKKKKE